MNQLTVYSSPTGMNSVTVNHTMDLFYLLKENFIVLFYQVIRFHKDGDFEEYPRTHYEALNQTLLKQTFWGSSHNIFYGLEAYGTH